MKLNLPDVQKFLTGHFKTEIIKVELTGEGEWSQAFFFQENNKDKVIRFSNLDEDFKRDQFASNFASAKLPIPKIEEIGKAFSGYFAISSKVDGKMIDSLNQTEVQQAIPALMDLFDSLRLSDTSKTHGFGAWDKDGNGIKSSWREFLINITADSPFSRINGWKEKLASNKEAFEIFNRTYQELLNIVSICPEERHVIHNDLLHFNVLVKDNKIVALIDWGCALYGDFLYDLAMFSLWQFYYPTMKDIDFNKEAQHYFAQKGVSLPHFKERLKCYQLHLALDSMAYSAFKENRKNMDLVIKRIKEIV